MAGTLSPPLPAEVPAVPVSEATPDTLALTDEERAALPPLDPGAPHDAPSVLSTELEDDAPEPDESDAAPPPWRTILMARKLARVALDGGVTEIFGGELVTDQVHVARLRGDVESFREIPVDSAEDIERIVAAREHELAELRERARSIGCHVVPDGTKKLPKL